MANPAVFDASAILAVLYNEPGAAKVIPRLHGALVSSANLVEVHACLLRNSSQATHARNNTHLWNRVLSMGFEVIPFSEPQARLAGELLEDQPQTALALGERACLALALERSATVYTANRAWQSLPINIEIEVIA